jgi:H+/Cl- antiporter ClcA
MYASGDICRYTGHTLAKFIITMVSGIFTGLFAVWMSTTVGTMFEWKNGFVQELLDEEGDHRVFMAYLWHAAYSCLLVSFAVALVSGCLGAAVDSKSKQAAASSLFQQGIRMCSWCSCFVLLLRVKTCYACTRSITQVVPAKQTEASAAALRAHCFQFHGCPSCNHIRHVAAAVGGSGPAALHLQVQYWAPQAAGAGVTLVMAYLNGNHVPNLLRLRTLVTKFVGTCCSVSAGLPMGPEGPMVHIGACLASVITYTECSEWLLCLPCV